MKTLIVYDSKFSHTEKIAHAISAGATGRVTVQHVSSADITGLGAGDLLVVGSPTQGGRPTPAIATFLKQIPDEALRHVRVAAFDTRFAGQDHNFGVRILMSVIGFAALRIVAALEHKGGALVAPGEGFIVEDTEGPLAPGELERATAWSRDMG